jgi:cellobiose-specific phosphotransferase system component IIA
LDVRQGRYGAATMTEAHSGEVEKVLLYVGDARDRAHAAAERVARAGADEHVVEALRDAERELGELHRQLTQQTFYAIPDTKLKLSV